MQDPTSCRELAEIEYQLILGMAGKGRRREDAIELFNKGRVDTERLNVIRGRQLHTGREVMLFRHDLPESVEQSLQAFERQIGKPLVG